MLAKAAADGHRVVLVFATKGEHGEVDDGFLDDGETLGERRVKETERVGRDPRRRSASSSSATSTPG